MSLKFEHVEISKNNFTILSELSFEIVENTVIYGESGSGKSLLLDAMSGRIFPTKGKIIKESQKKLITVARDYSFHQLVGPVYQYYQQRFNTQDAELGPTVYEVLQNQIKPVGTINENSVMVPPPQYAEDWLKIIVKKMKLEGLLYQKITSLSNGETRKSLIAIALLKKPDILLLDNPFTGLDIKSREDLKVLLSELKGIVIVLVASPNDIPKNFKKCIFLENKSIGFIGKKNEYIPKVSYNWNIDNALLKEITAISSLQFKPFESFENAISITNGYVKYGNKFVLEGINWKVKKGEKWALMGPNGSGKSSLLSIIIGDNPQCYQNELYLFDKRRGSGESIWD